MNLVLADNAIADLCYFPFFSAELSFTLTNSNSFKPINPSRTRSPLKIQPTIDNKFYGSN